jgi:hypothetical protein
MSRTLQSEPLYIIYLHNPQAEQQLKQWYSNNPTASVQVTGARMRIFDDRSWSLFRVNWSGDWDSVTIWDTWRRCHIRV